MAARQCFGVSKCWTKYGFIIVIRPDGKRHSVVLCVDIDLVPAVIEAQAQVTSTTATIQTIWKSDFLYLYVDMYIKSNNICIPNQNDNL